MLRRIFTVLALLAAVVAMPVTSMARPPAPHTQCMVWGEQVYQNSNDWWWQILDCDGACVAGQTPCCHIVAHENALWDQYEFVQDCLAGEDSCTGSNTNPFC